MKATSSTTTPRRRPRRPAPGQADPAPLNGDANGSEYDELGLLVGARAIARYRGEPLRRTTYLLEKGLVPGFKHGGRWCSTKRAQRAFIERLEREAAEK